jgi:hypothetical protein
MGRFAVLYLAVSAACGDDDGALSDAGSDAGHDASHRRPDAGPGDAGPQVVRAACDPARTLGPYPAPSAWPANRGPGGPTRTFSEAELYENCAFLDGGEGDESDHHNLVVMYDGYLLMPWATEASIGGLTLWDITDPCAPVQAGYGYAPEMRETHSIGFSHANGRWAVTDMLDLARGLNQGGILFWDMSDTSAPVPSTAMVLPGFGYPDAYARVVLSVFWQVPYVYAGGADNGVYIIDASDPLAPELVDTYAFEPTLRVGQVQAIGNLLIATAAEGARTVLLDISDPENPQPIPNGDFDALDETGEVREAYFTNTANGYVYYARKDSGGGLMIMDIRDPSAPVFAGGLRSEGNGGYVFLKEGFAFEGEGSFATMYDVRDPAAIAEVARFMLTGDLDTITPIGNVAVLSVDADANEDQGSSVAPYATAPDTTPPVVTWLQPRMGEPIAPTSRIGVSFSEFVDVGSAWEGSVRLYRTGTDPNTTRVDGLVSAQEHIVNFHPCAPLAPDTEYTFEIPAGGIVDLNGNAIAETFTATFRTTP